MPGFYELRESTLANGETVQPGSIAVLTRLANELMANIHHEGIYPHRMPLFLTPKLEEIWGYEHCTDEDMKALFDDMFPAKALDCHTVYNVHGKKSRPDGKPKFGF